MALRPGRGDQPKAGGDFRLCFQCDRTARILPCSRKGNDQMSDFDPSRPGQHRPRASAGGSGAGLLWLLGVLAVLGVVVFIGSVGGGGIPVATPADTEAETQRGPSQLQSAADDPPD